MRAGGHWVKEEAESGGRVSVLEQERVYCEERSSFPGGAMRYLKWGKKEEGKEGWNEKERH